MSESELDAAAEDFVKGLVCDSPYEALGECFKAGYRLGCKQAVCNGYRAEKQSIDVEDVGEMPKGVL